MSDPPNGLDGAYTRRFAAPDGKACWAGAEWRADVASLEHAQL